MRKRLDGIAQVVLRHFFRLLPVIVDATFVFEHAIPVEHETVWRADGAVCLRHFLRFVVAIREWIILRVMSFLHRLERIIWIFGCIVAVDENELNAFFIEVLLELNQAALDRLRIGTVIAGENNDDHGIFDEDCLDRHTIRRWQIEIRHRITNFQRRRVIIHEDHGLEYTPDATTFHCHGVHR